MVTPGPSTPSGGDAPITGTTGAWVQLTDLLRLANALGAAVRLEAAGYLGSPPNESGRSGYFWTEYVQLAGGVIPGSAQSVEGRIPLLIRATVATGAWSATHISTGEMSAYDAPSGLTETLEVTEATEF